MSFLCCELSGPKTISVQSSMIGLLPTSSHATTWREVWHLNWWAARMTVQSVRSSKNTAPDIGPATTVQRCKRRSRSADSGDNSSTMQSVRSVTLKSASRIAMPHFSSRFPRCPDTALSLVSGTALGSGCLGEGIDGPASRICLSAAASARCAISCMVECTAAGPTRDLLEKLNVLRGLAAATAVSKRCCSCSTSACFCRSSCSGSSHALSCTS
mmetsp:Transcript_14711/g.44439  ORF Transcript_14711/g.44439 Transcript_14711/m.44439 type:complete len:214 (-) Transcript_14711:435-1076(-)